MNNARRKITIRRGSAMPCIVPKPANGRPCALDGSTIETERLSSSCSKQDHVNEIIESQKIRTINSKHKTRQDRNADRGHVPMSHNNMVHKPISIFQAVGIPAASVSMDWSKWRMNHTSLCGMLINGKVLLVDRTLPQLKTPQIIHDSSATNTRIKHTTFAAHFRIDSTS